MKAAVIRKAGGGVEIEERERPAPGPDEVLIRVHACGVTSFASIFRGNCLKNGLLPNAVKPAFHKKMVAGAGGAWGGAGVGARAGAPPGVTIDLGARTISLGDGTSTPFPIDPYTRYCLPQGLDEVNFLLKHRDAFYAFEGR